jgi:hypothetical protein
VTVEEQIRQRLARLAPVELELAEAFRGKPTVARHRMVYDALTELIDNPIHALAISARAPGEPGA